MTEATLIDLMMLVAILSYATMIRALSLHDGRCGMLSAGVLAASAIGCGWVAFSVTTPLVWMLSGAVGRAWWPIGF
ncbi:MAG: hypothetical protein AAF577_12230 [Pseudomonadota bacterium]